LRPRAAQTLHAVLRKGTAPGARVVFPDAGSETGELLPGDVVITVREARARAQRP
jgi:hypothetical protein